MQTCDLFSAQYHNLFLYKNNASLIQPSIHKKLLKFQEKYNVLAGTSVEKLSNIFDHITCTLTEILKSQSCTRQMMTLLSEISSIKNIHAHKLTHLAKKKRNRLSNESDIHYRAITLLQFYSEMLKNKFEVSEIKDINKNILKAIKKLKDLSEEEKEKILKSIDINITKLFITSLDHKGFLDFSKLVKDFYSNCISNSFLKEIKMNSNLKVNAKAIRKELSALGIFIIADAFSREILKSIDGSQKDYETSSISNYIKSKEGEESAYEKQDIEKSEKLKFDDCTLKSDL